MTGIQTGKVAIVTGGTANLGKLFAESLASDGANVVVHYNSVRRAEEAARLSPNSRHTESRQCPTRGT